MPVLHTIDHPELTRRTFLLWLVLLTLFAWLLREYFVLVTVVDIPVRGDVRDYVSYAWNLLNHGVFSHTWPALATPVPDNFRGPGYPLFLAICMAVEPDPNGWYSLALHGQAVLGGLTAPITVLLARHWLPRNWSLFTGFLVALWPHHIAATGAMLTEVVFGFALALAMLMAAETITRRSTAWAIACGIVFSYAILTNMVSLMLPLLVASFCWRAAARRAAALLLICALVVPGLWGLREVPAAATDVAIDRITLNFVQGSWPQYHRAYISRGINQTSRDIMGAIRDEEQQLASDRATGLSNIISRLADDPVYYLHWYVLEKPFLLWDWGIRMGAGDIYFHQVSHSPLEAHKVLHAIKRSFEILNPAIFVLSSIATLALLGGWIRQRRWASPVAVLVACFCIYVTAVHVALQAEPRYSIAYRPMELLMLSNALFWLAKIGKAWLQGDAKRHIHPKS